MLVSWYITAFYQILFILSFDVSVSIPSHRITHANGNSGPTAGSFSSSFLSLTIYRKVYNTNKRTLPAFDLSTKRTDNVHFVIYSYSKRKIERSNKEISMRIEMKNVSSFSDHMKDIVCNGTEYENVEANVKESERTKLTIFFLFFHSFVCSNKTLWTIQWKMCTPFEIYLVVTDETGTQRQKHQSTIFFCFIL